MKTTRRSFLFTSGSLMAAGMLSPNINANILRDTNDQNKDVKVGAHPWVYAADLPGYDITPEIGKIFEDVKYAGYDGLELMHHPLRSHHTTLIIKDATARYGLPIIGTSYGADMWDKEKHQQILEDATIIIDNLADAGGRTLGTSVGQAPSRKTEDQLDAQAELLEKLIKICSDREIVLNLHNHTYEVEDGMHDLKGTLERIPDIKLGPDLNWLQRAGVDPVSFLKEYGERIVFMHLRDQDSTGKWTESLGEGDVNFKVIGKTIKKIDFSGDIVIELAHEPDFVTTRSLRESLKMSREYLRETTGY